ncbi:MAG: hypothetical protein ACREJU_03075, partial [Nitrospiraceae bacterium]
VKTASEPDPYPYEIRAVMLNPDTDVSENLNPWAVQEFFRIEAWLRSKIVMELYRTEGRTTESDVKLMVKCRFNWNVLEGSHHRYLEAGNNRDTVVPGIWVLSAKELTWLAGALSSVEKDETSTLKQQIVQWVHDQVYWLCVDPALPPEVALKVIRPILTQHFKASRDALKEPRPFDLMTWLGYLRCYDFRVRDGLPYDEIGERVSPAEAGQAQRDQARKAVMKIRSLIESVERNEWPPSSL